MGFGCREGKEFCKGLNQYFAVRIGTFIKHQISVFRVSGNSRLAKHVSLLRKAGF
ncbi:hypothetical protein HMPREF0602_1091 [Neisseria meningitidis ATCC 13091]|uniref:Uncharacterized protein n=2 Tax=Neisseria meningitidis TaxID=487 RepID=E0N9B1_NEIM3|nr:hypothetical protein HMPREF0602_1091 [Neisseria meningitidis ATCC 13091]CBA05956.1 hypothetical protein predicted by Glimmer/Critica [Neisseria meningitidis alpha275]